MYKRGLEKAEEPEIKLPKYVGSEKAREFQENICFIDYAKAFHCVDHNKLWKILEEMGIPDHLTCLLRTLYAGQEATVRTGHGTDFPSSKATLWGKAQHEGALPPPCIVRKDPRVHTQLDEGPETPRATREASRVPFLRQDEAYVPCPDLTLAS